METIGDIDEGFPVLDYWAMTAYSWWMLLDTKMV